MQRREWNDRQFYYVEPAPDPSRPLADQPPGYYLPKRPLLPRWIHRLMVVTLAVVYLAIGQSIGLIDRGQSHAPDYSSQQGWEKTDAIATAALRDPTYTAAQCTADTMRIYEVHTRTNWGDGETPIHQNVIVTIREHAADCLVHQSYLPRWQAEHGTPGAETRWQLRQQALRAVETDLGIKQRERLNTPINWAGCKRLLLGLYLLGLPFAAVIMLGRVAVASRTRNEAYGLIWGASRIEFPVLLLIWPLALFHYKPDNDLLYRAINDLAEDRGSEKRWSPVWAQRHERPTCPTWLQAEADVLTWRLPRLELLRAVWSWRPPQIALAAPQLNWPTLPNWLTWPTRLHLQPVRLLAHLSYASYATVMLVVMMATGSGRAADTSLYLLEKGGDHKPIIPNLRIGSAKPSHWQVWLYGAPPNTIGELSYSIGQFHIGDLRSTWAPYGRYDPRHNQVTQIGLTGALDCPLGGGKVVGAWYAGLTPTKGGGGVFAPNLRWLHAVGHDGVKIGVGVGVSCAYRTRPDLKIGPYVQLPLGKEGMLLRGRYAIDPRHTNKGSEVDVELFTPF